MREHALTDKGRKVQFIGVNNRASFENAWNNLGTKEDGISYKLDDVYIISHGSERALILVDGSRTEALSINGENLLHEPIGNINDLQEKTMKNLYLLSCNAGNLDQYFNGTDEVNGRGVGNVASIFSKKVKNGIVKAYDGNVGFGISILSAFGIGGYEARLSNNQSNFNEVSRHYGKNTNWRNPKGLVTYYNGEYKPYGYFPNTFINAA